MTAFVSRVFRNLPDRLYYGFISPQTFFRSSIPEEHDFANRIMPAASHFGTKPGLILNLATIPHRVEFCPDFVERCVPPVFERCQKRGVPSGAAFVPRRVRVKIIAGRHGLSLKAVHPAVISSRKMLAEELHRIDPSRIESRSRSRSTPDFAEESPWILNEPNAPYRNASTN